MIKGKWIKNKSGIILTKKYRREYNILSNLDVSMKKSLLFKGDSKRIEVEPFKRIL